MKEQNWKRTKFSRYCILEVIFNNYGMLFLIIIGCLFSFCPPSLWETVETWALNPREILLVHHLAAPAWKVDGEGGETVLSPQIIDILMDVQQKHILESCSQGPHWPNQTSGPRQVERSTCLPPAMPRQRAEMGWRFCKGSRMWPVPKLQHIPPQQGWQKPEQSTVSISLHHWVLPRSPAPSAAQMSLPYGK